MDDCVEYMLWAVYVVCLLPVLIMAAPVVAAVVYLFYTIVTL